MGLFLATDDYKQQKRAKKEKKMNENKQRILIICIIKSDQQPIL